MANPTKVLIFTGAGAGVPLGLPTSTDFMKEVNGSGASVTQSVTEFLRATSEPAQAEDIEWILATLEAFKTERTFIEHVLPRVAAGLPPANPSGLTHVQQKLAALKGEARTEVRRIKKALFEKLARYDHNKAATLYRGLLSELQSHYGSFALSMVTTNYDLTFETTLEEQGEGAWEAFGITQFDFGFSTNRFGRPIYDAKRDLDWKPGTLEFLKVHGSLDWHRDERRQCSRSLSKTIPDDPDEMAIVYPGYFKGVPEVEPFISLHGRLSERLAQADVVFVVGFAFRDAYINSIFENSLRSRKALQLHYINPLAMKAHPSGSMAPRLATAFSNFHHAERRVEATDSPLNLASLITMTS